LRGTIRGAGSEKEGGRAVDGDLSDLRARFGDVVTSEAAVRAVTGEAHQRALDKVVRVIDGHSRRFIAAAPFVFVASTSADGTLDVSPKGDPAGFVKVLDERTLAIPDRLGNRRFDTFRNVLQNPAVGLIFLVPGITYTLRISGTAIIVRDEALRRDLAVKGKLPDHVLVVAVSRVLSHCPKCMIRSGLWRPEAWPDPDGVPAFAETLVAHARLAESVEAVHAAIETANRDQLY
jgi:PPOX class probable FMN-dependent enzyme